MSLDLEALRRAEPAAVAPPRALSRRLVPIVVILALAGAAFFLLKPVIFPPRRVMTAAVRVETGAARGATAAEAAGWIEPDPYPTVVRPLVDGIVESIDVLEGAVVKANETLIGRLKSAPLAAAVERTERTLSLKEKQVIEAQAELTQATALLKQRLDLKREVARLEGEVGVAKAAQAAAESDIAAASQGLVAARADLSAQESLEKSGTGFPIVKARAEAAVLAAEAVVEGKRADLGRAAAVVASTSALLDLAREGEAHPEALIGAERIAAARLESAKADVGAAEADRNIATREAGWLLVKAPVDGVVLRRESAPGSVIGPSVMPRGGGGDSGRMVDSGEGALVTLYDPKRLQARIDVQLGSVGGVGAGRKAEMTVEALSGRTFHGTVTRVQSQADPLKNTLQVKVRIDDPDPLLRPEMLVRARFLVDSSMPAAGGGGATEARILVPKQALKGSAVFVFDPTGGGRARRIPVVKGSEDGDSVEVRGDVSATQRVILDDVEDGERVNGGGS